jgi:hypothetical protein
MKKPREFWIFKRNGASDIVFDRPMRTVERDETVHVIEKSAYDELNAELTRVKAEYYEASAQASRKYNDLKYENVVLRRAYKYLYEHSRNVKVGVK